MADLPRYQRPGVLLGEVGRYDMANFREASRGSAQLNESLNQLSRWAYEQAAQEAKSAGEQFGAENPVTKEQILEGTATFAPRGSIFGEAARGIQLDAVTTDIEIEAQTRLNNLKARAKAGEIDPIGAIAEIKDLQDGYSEALRKVDPRASNKFRSSMATAGNSALLAIQEEATKQAKNRTMGLVDTFIDTIVPEQVRSHLAAGDTKDPETGEVITPEMRIDATIRRPLMAKLLEIGEPEFGRLARRRLESEIERQTTTAVADYASSDEFLRGDPSGALGRLQRGELDKYSSTYQRMSGEQKLKVRYAFMQRLGDAHTLGQREDKEREEAQKREIYGLMSQYWTMPEGRQKSALRQQIVSKGQGVLTFDQLKTLMEPKKPEGEGKENVNLEVRAIDLVRRGGVTDLADLQRRVPGLTAKQLKRAQDMIYDAGDRQLREGVRTLAGIPEGLVQMTGDQQRRFQTLNGEVDRLKADAIAKTGTYDPAVIMGQLRERREQVTDERNVSTAKQALERLGTGRRPTNLPWYQPSFTAAPVNVTISENDSEADLKAKGFNPAEIKTIQQHQRTIRGE